RQLRRRHLARGRVADADRLLALLLGRGPVDDRHGARLRIGVEIGRHVDVARPPPECARAAPPPAVPPAAREAVEAEAAAVTVPREPRPEAPAEGAVADAEAPGQAAVPARVPAPAAARIPD